MSEWKNLVHFKMIYNLFDHLVEDIHCQELVNFYDILF